MEVRFQLSIVPKPFVIPLYRLVNRDSHIMVMLMYILDSIIPENHQQIIMYQ